MPQNPWNIKEKQLEDWICANPDFLGYHLQILGRQIRLSCGFLDVLAYYDGIHIIELKARPLLEKDVGQVLRYTGDIKQLLLDIAVDWGIIIDKKEDWMRKSPFSAADSIGTELFARIGLGNDEKLAHAPFQPILIGSDVSANIIFSANSVDIQVFRWTYNEETNSFGIMPAINQLRTFNGYPEWLQTMYRLILDSSIKAARECLEQDSPPKLIFNN